MFANHSHSRSKRRIRIVIILHAGALRNIYNPFGDKLYLLFSPVNNYNVEIYDFLLLLFSTSYSSRTNNLHTNNNLRINDAWRFILK